VSNLPEIDIPTPEELRDRFARGVAILIALATLVAASVGFLQNAASSHANAASIQASQLGVASLGALVGAQQDAQVDYETYSIAAEQRARAANGFLRGALAESGTAENASGMFQRDLQTLLADKTDGLTTIKLDGEDGPRNDPAFPARYFAKATRESVRLSAEQDAANEAAQAWGDQATVYTAILAMLAVTLYLFGLALTVSEQRIRRGFAAVGVAIVAVGTLWTVMVSLSPPRAADPAAAAAFADAHVDLLAAVDRDGYTRAVAEYDRAITLRPTFARAYKERASAIFFAGSPQHGGLPSLVDPASLVRSRADLAQARALGLSTSSVIGDAAFQTFLQGVQQGDKGVIEEAVKDARTAVDLAPAEPVLRFNLAVALFAAGRLDEADEAYRKAVVTLVYVDADRKERRGDPLIEEQVLAGALTDLEVVAAHRPDLADRVLQLKQYLVASVAQEEPTFPADTGATIATVGAVVLPAELEWTGKLTNWDTARDVLSLQWYYRGPEGLGWSVIPSVSGVVDVTRDNYNLRSYLASVSPPRCLPDGDYRAELYVNGRLIAAPEARGENGDLRAWAARDLTVSLCRPPDWTEAEVSYAGLFDGFESPDKKSGIALFRLGVPARGLEHAQASVAVMDFVVDAFKGLFEAPPVAEGEPQEAFFLGLSGARWRWYDYGAGRLRAAAGVDPTEGSVFLVLAYAPREAFDEPTMNLLLDSLARIP